MPLHDLATCLTHTCLALSAPITLLFSVPLDQAKQTSTKGLLHLLSLCLWNMYLTCFTFPLFVIMSPCWKRVSWCLATWNRVVITQLLSTCSSCCFSLFLFLSPNRYIPFLDFVPCYSRHLDLLYSFPYSWHLDQFLEHQYLLNKWIHLNFTPLYSMCMNLSMWLNPLKFNLFIHKMKSKLISHWCC